MSGVLILGAGGHAKVVADILRASGIRVIGFLDDDPVTWQQQRLNLPVLGPIDSFENHAPDGLALGVGSNHGRQTIVERLGTHAEQLWHNAIHPSAVVAPSVRLGRGVVVAAGAIINPDSTIGDYAIVNTAASVDHDCLVGDFAHIAPASCLTGGVRIGEGTLVGAGSTITPYRSVGAWSVIGAGAVVTQDIPSDITAVGVPARVIRHP